VVARAGRQPRRVDEPEDEALIADSVGLRCWSCSETLTPSERLAFVLHDMFAVPFDEIGAIVGRSPDAARQLASRGRRRVRGAPLNEEVGLARQRELVDAFLAASRAGDFEALVAVLDPDVVFRADTGPAAGWRGRRSRAQNRSPAACSNGADRSRILHSRRS
jgi:RNA polymerase sigma-70 factor (ECF subfamily)